MAQNDLKLTDINFNFQGTELNKEQEWHKLEVYSSKLS